MGELFETTWIKSLELSNRAIRSATWSGVGDRKGYVTDRAIEIYRELGRGGIGLIVTGYQHVMHNGQQTPHMIGNYEDGQIEGLSRLVQAVHDEGGKVIPQLAHSGARANPDLFRNGDELWGPSAIPDAATGNVPKEMTRQQIGQLVEAYGAAARRSLQAGFDGLQLHGAHGYGITQFLSEAWNRRTDEYGGSLSNRYRFLGEVLEAVRGAVGEDFPIMIKLNVHDYMDGGLVPEESIEFARRMVADGIDAIEVSGGTASSPKEKRPLRRKILSVTDEAYFGEFAALMKETVDVPVITIGGIRSLGVIHSVLGGRTADYVALSRPFIREPHLINRWKEGDTRKATCISCSHCYNAAMEGNGVYCAEERKARNGRNRGMQAACSA